MAQWQTVDDYQYHAPQATYNTGLAVGAEGITLMPPAPPTLLTARRQKYPGLIRAESRQRNTWASLDHYLYPNMRYMRYSGIAADSQGDVFVPGPPIGMPPPATPLTGTGLFVAARMEEPTWYLLDDFVPGSGGNGMKASVVTIDSAGNVYVAGVANYGVAGHYADASSAKRIWWH